MNAFRSLFFIAVLAGFAAGVVMTGLQAFFTVPLILEAETFESAGAAVVPDEYADTAKDGYDAEAWAPTDGLERMAFTALANIVTAVGFALLLAATSEFAGGISTWREGLFWGLAAFATFTLAPGFGLPPDLPAMPAAELLSRQVWWLGCVAATAAGLMLMVFGRSAALAILGATLLILPHVVGAPQPESHVLRIPADLHHRFVVAVTVTNLLFWLMLGLMIAVVRPRFAASLKARPGQLV